ncbi:hypothetical protein ACTWP5_24190 [Streptomyces sp. 4N509B]|uniref:hypothetical protein n=1 Tax=Streptomyces sp. 4N509B TaxID=3457413 RepID=UPI003FCF7642
MLDEAWQKRARVAFLGRDWRGQFAVLTPIRRIHTRMSVDATQQDGWWPTCVLGDAVFVEVPQGSVVQDLLFALPRGTAVTFIGLAGGLRGQRIGSVLDPVSAIAPSRTARVGERWLTGGWRRAGRRTYPAASQTPGVEAATVSCLAESTLRHRQLVHVADCVDLEAGHLFAASPRAGVALRCLLVISDHNAGGAVFTSRLEQLDPAIDQLCESVRAELTGCRR